MTKPSLPRRAILPLLIGTLLHSVFVSSAVLAQVNVAVNAGSVVAPLPSTAIGLHTSVYANQFGNAVLPSRIAGAGIDILRYPGGSYSDIYHWTNHTATGGYAASQSNFGRFVQIMDQAGTQGMVTVNYGSSHQYTKGGQPKEAAAWVAYANGDASLFGTANDLAIGVDDEGNNWRTVGYWARLRTLTAAQNLDNQYDFLAIDHDQPVGIKYWEIGNELNGNGYYSDINSNFNWEKDLHAPGGTVRGKNPALSPTTYGTNFNSFAAAMKAVDPTIKVGAALTGIGGVGDVADPTRNWDRNVLTTAGASMDFAVLHSYPESGNNINTLLNATDDLPAWFQGTRNRINTYVGAGAADRIELHMTEFGYFGTISNPVIDGVYAANTYATALADGVKSVHWLELSKDSFLGDAAAQTRGPAYDGIQVFSHIAETGAEFVDTTSSDGNVEVHSTRLADGRVGILIANLNSSGTSSVNINITGAALDASGTTWLYGVNQTTPLTTLLTSGLGSTFAVNVPFQSILAVLVDAAPNLPGDFNQNGIVDAADYLTWRKSVGTTYLPSDYDEWRAHFGQTAGAGATANYVVPEPPRWVISVITLTALCNFARLVTVRRASTRFECRDLSAGRIFGLSARGRKSIMIIRRGLKVHCAFLIVNWYAQTVALPALAITPDNPGPAAIQFTADSGQNVKSISPYIYGSNSSSITNRTFDRAGGNRWTGYNWENNASNAGADWYHHNDYLLTNGQANQPPGAAVSGMIQSAAIAGRAALITLPIAGYVAADGNGTVDETEVAPSSRWKQVVAKKTTIYPGSALSNNPDKTDDYVFTDEFVHWAETTKQAGQPLWYSLDNEPGLWGEALPAGWQSGVEPNPCCNPANGVNPSPEGRTHPLIHPYAPTFAEMRSKTIANATAIKDVNPNALVFGGVGYGWNDFTSLQNAPDAVTMPSHPGGDQSGEMHYNEWLLQQVRNEEVVQGRKLMDVLDLHWYPEATGGGVRITGSETTSAVVNARVQAPRSLWDPTYTETSWISQWGTWVGSPGTPGPVKLLPRVQRDIDDFNPGTKVAITEYNYGGGNHYSGGIAEADVLGTLGRQGVFAASWWDVGNGSSYVNAAFNIYRNYNGTGGKFGDTSIDANTSNIANSAVYASVDSSNPNRMVIVAINRTGSSQTTGIAVANDRVFDHAEVYRFISSSASIARQADIQLDLLNAFQYTMPAWSVTTIILMSDGLPGDFNRDGQVNAADYTVWRKQLGQTGNITADANEDNVVDVKDYNLWKSNFGRAESAGSGASATVPELSTFHLALLAACALVLHGRTLR